MATGTASREIVTTTLRIEDTLPVSFPAYSLLLSTMSGSSDNAEKEDFRGRVVVISSELRP